MTLPGCARISKLMLQREVVLQVGLFSLLGLPFPQRQLPCSLKIIFGMKVDHYGLSGINCPISPRGPFAKTVSAQVPMVWGTLLGIFQTFAIL
ncbi:MAG: hypothetical protein BM559_00990 [Roseobacter sp. MedPE-SWchi]|nr:MAG: hypothetical protein BM559_00990 [Roseobacter sp. MedPE-SWchi]